MEINEQKININIETTAHNENTNNSEVVLTLQDLIAKQPQRKKKENKNIKKIVNEKAYINELWNSNSEEKWHKALETYWNLVRPENMNLEKKFDSIDNRLIRSMSVDKFYDFLHDEYFVWKYTAKNRLATTRNCLVQYKNNSPMEELNLIHTDLFKFDLQDVAKGLSIAKNIKGLGTAGASGLLSILFPEDFGTVDQFIVKSLLNIQGLPEYKSIEAMNPESLSINDGVLLINIMKKKAKELNNKFQTNAWTPRKIDMILWSIDR